MHVTHGIAFATAFVLAPTGTEWQTAALKVNFACTLSPERIVIGGGVMSRAPPYPMVRQEVLIC
jgi:hypothetical protein